jgi:hypothetical protein
MNGFVLVGAALPVAATYLLLQPVRIAGASRACAIALAIGIGLGIASCTFFLSLVLFDGRRPAVIGIDVALLAIALAVWRSQRSDTQPAAARAPLTLNERVLAVVVLVAAAAAAASFLANVLDTPHGRWDAWATWNMRARWLADGASAWRDAFAKPNIHRDYPLLLPATVARLWVYGDVNDPAVPAAVAAAYGTALVLLLYAALAALRGRAQAFVGALCLLGTPLFLRVAPWQYADVPLAFNLLSAVTLLSLYDRDPVRGRSMLLWAGVATGLAAWTKNEGMMLAVAIVAVRGALMIVRRAPELRSAAWFAAGLLPPAAIVLYFKLALAGRSPQFGQTSESMIGKLVDLGRYGAVVVAAASELLRGAGPVLLGIVAYAILLGRTRDQSARGIAVAVASIVGFAAFGDTLGYVITRADLAWQLGLSMERLVMQLWPSVLFAVLLYVASPSERDVPSAAPAPAGRMPTKPVAHRRRRASRR